MTGLESIFEHELISINFGIGFYSLRFQKDDSLYDVGTSDFISLGTHDLSDALEKVSTLLWPFLSQTLTSAKIHENENYRGMELFFDNEQSIFFWQEFNALDNLLHIENLRSKETYVLL